MTYFIMEGVPDIESDYATTEEINEAIDYMRENGEEVHTLDGVDDDMIVTDGQHIGYRDIF